MQTDPGKLASGNRGPAHKKDEMNKEDPTQGIPDWLQPFHRKSRGLGDACARTFLWREISDSEGDASKVGHKNGSTVLILTSPKTGIATYA